MTMKNSRRDYQAVAARLRPSTDRQQQMQAVVAALWQALRDTGLSWVGFYLHDNPNELVLAACQPKPACSPIGLHGVCGRAFRTRQPVVVPDVLELGPNYVACDPRDRSEVVVPCLDSDGTCWGVLDLDSHQVAAFSQADVVGLQMVLRAAGLTL